MLPLGLGVLPCQIVARAHLCSAAGQRGPVMSAQVSVWGEPVHHLARVPCRRATRGPASAAWSRGGGTGPSSSDSVALSLPRPGPSVGVSLGVLPPRSGSVALPNSDSCPTVQPCGRASRPSDLRPCAPRGLRHETELHTPQPGSVAQLGRPVSELWREAGLPQVSPDLRPCASRGWECCPLVTGR